MGFEAAVPGRLRTNNEWFRLKKRRKKLFGFGRMTQNKRPPVSSDLQSYRCPPDAAGSLHCPCVAEQNCDSHTGTVSMVIRIK